MKTGARRKRSGASRRVVLSPLLANIMLDPLDKTIESMGLPFARYADDFLIVTKTKAEALAAMALNNDYLKGKGVPFMRDLRFAPSIWIILFPNSVICET